MKGKALDLGMLKRLYAFIRPNRKYLFLSLFCSLISVLASLLATVLAGEGVDCIVGAGNVDFKRLGLTAAAIGVVVAVIFVSEWLQNIFIQKLAYKIVRNIRNDSMETLQNAPLSYIDSRDKGDILSRVITDVTEISDGLLLGFTQLFNGVVTIAATLVIMLVLRWEIALVVGIFTPLSLLIANYVAKHSAAEFKKQAVKRGEMTALVDEMVGNQKVVKAFLQEENNTEKFEKINDELKESGVKATFFSSLPNPSTRFVNNIIYIAVGLIGALMVIGDPAAFTVGTLTAFLMYAGKYAKPFNEISGVVTELQNALACAARVFELIDEKPQTADPADPKVPETVEGAMEISHVDFSYEDDVKILDDVSFDIKPGETIALVGPTGAGKTTIVNLISRFYDIQNGHILIDGHDIRQVTIESLRQQMGIMTQDNFLFTGTIRDNIRYGKLDATGEEIIAAAKAVHAHDFIMDLKDGYDTMLTERGGGLSVGQKQLLAFARTMVSNPNILILDEATSSIDTQTELLVQEGIDALLKGRTSFVIAHRLSTIQKADRIFVIDHGGIVEEGSADELLAKKGAYYRLHNAQLKFS